MADVNSNQVANLPNVMVAFFVKEAEKLRLVMADLVDVDHDGAREAMSRLAPMVGTFEHLGNALAIKQAPEVPPIESSEASAYLFAPKLLDIDDDYFRAHTKVLDKARDEIGIAINVGASPSTLATLLMARAARIEYLIELFTGLKEEDPRGIAGVMHVLHPLAQEVTQFAEALNDRLALAERSEV